MTLPHVAIRTTPDDFVVEEIPAYAPSGAGEHLFVTFRKRGMTTPFALRRLAEALDVDPRAAGSAGMKDRHAVTTQTISFQVPLDRDAVAAAEALAIDDLEILSAKRHGNKLKTGHLIGNRFRLVLRAIAPDDVDGLVASLEEAGRRGVPNAFGAQRFGRDGDNVSRALSWIAGDARPPRDKRKRRLLYSAFQSAIFNRVLEERVADGTWDTVMAGDIAQKHESGGVFPIVEEELEEGRARAAALEICATGPMVGPKMRSASGAVAEQEQNALAALVEDASVLTRWRKLGEGTRRPMRLLVQEMKVERLEGEDAAAASIAVSFVLPKGGYATTVLDRVCRWVDRSRHEPPPAAGH